MRGLIVDYARNRQALKRGGEFELTAISTDALAWRRRRGRELGRMSDALDELAGIEPLLAEVVDLKYFCGFSFDGDRGDEGPVGADRAPELDEGAGLSARARCARAPRDVTRRSAWPRPPRELADRQPLSRYRAGARRRGARGLAGGASAPKIAGLADRIAQWLAECDALERGRFPRRRRRRRARAGGARRLAARRLPPDRADRPRRHGQRVAGRTQRRPLRGPRRRQAVERRAGRPRRRRALCARRAASSRGWRIRRSRTSSTPASRRSVSPIWCWSTSTASRSTASATRVAWRRRPCRSLPRRARAGRARPRETRRAPGPEAFERDGHR